MAQKLLVVESPTKSRTIEKFLGKEYKIIASFGHVRDLPKSKLGVDVEKNFAPQYVTPSKARKNVTLIKKEAEKAKEIYLATDPDREGEAIAWHISKIIGRANAKRIVFHEITKGAIEKAISNPRDLDVDLFNAQQARRILDRLVGYNLSPLLWKKVKKGLSAGRVQSVALKMIVDREREIEAFKSVEYWEIFADLEKDKEHLVAKLESKNGEKLEIGNEKDARTVENELKDEKFVVADITKKEVKRNPAPPFITSTLQQDAGRKLGYSAKKTMMIAQQLYEGLDLGERGTTGLITYMRTDSTNLSESFKNEAKQYIQEKYGKNYLSSFEYKFKKSKSSQDAHEAIRPSSLSHDPESIKEHLTREQYKLYSLIFNRALASRMAQADFTQARIDVVAGPYELKSTDRKLNFDGFLKVYQESKDENEEAKPNVNVDLFKKGDTLKLNQLSTDQKFTQPPARLTEASLIKALEEQGIGRPSTYAPTISTILARRYVRIEDRKLYPEVIGVAVTELLEKNFPFVVNTEFTADMENKLDDISEGKIAWTNVLEGFWDPFKKQLDEKSEKIERVKLPVKETDEVCEKCGSKMVIKMGRFGEFLACSNFPDCKNARPLKKTTGLACPKCKEGEITEKRTKRGRRFWGCSRYPECDFATWNNPVAPQEQKKI